MLGTPVWIKLPGIPMEFWIVQYLCVIGNQLGKTILMDDSFLYEGYRSIARILVDLDVSRGIFETIDLVFKEKRYSQMLDYVNIPFLCLRCHLYGHL
jgi:hypothetical protein